MTKQADMESWNMQMVQDMMENGTMISNMGLVSKHGLMGLNIKDTITKEWKLDLENIAGQMELVILENGLIIHSMVTGLTNMEMAEYTLDTGQTTRCMEKVSISSKTEDSTMEIISLIKKKDMVFMFMQMEEPILVAGQMESNMLKEYLTFIYNT